MHRVSRHDAASDIFNRCVFEFVWYRCQASANILHWILTTDNTGRGNKHVFCPAANLCRDSFNNLASIAHAFGASRNIGILRNHYDGARRIVCEVLSAEYNTRASKTALRKHASRNTRTFGNNKRQIL